MGGSTKQHNTTPEDIRPLRQDFANWLRQPPSGRSYAQGSQGSASYWQPPQQQQQGVPGQTSTPQGFNGGGSQGAPWWSQPQQMGGQSQGMGGNGMGGAGPQQAPNAPQSWMGGQGGGMPSQSQNFMQSLFNGPQAQQGPSQASSYNGYDPDGNPYRGGPGPNPMREDRGPPGYAPVPPQGGPGGLPQWQPGSGAGTPMGQPTQGPGTQPMGGAPQGGMPQTGGGAGPMGMSGGQYGGGGPPAWMTGGAPPQTGGGTPWSQGGGESQGMGGPMPPQSGPGGLPRWQPGSGGGMTGSGQVNAQGIPMEWLASGAGPRGNPGDRVGPPKDESPPEGGPMEGGGGYPRNNAFSQMFATPQGGPVQLAQTPLPGQPGQINPALISMSGMPQVNAQQLNPNSFNPMTQGMSSVGTQFSHGMNGSNMPQQQDFNRGQIRDAFGGGTTAQGTQSVDQLGGAQSAFFRNMQDQLRPAFSQNRAEALAAAKEGLGNMGSGTALANSLGTAMNRSLGSEQAALANYATQGMQTEVGRQLQDASQANQVGMNNAGLSLSAQQGNQGADQGFLNSLINQGQMKGNLALGMGNLNLGAAGLGLQGQMANQNTLAGLAGQGSQNALSASQSNQGANMNAQGMNQGAWMQGSLANQGAQNASQAQNISNWMNQGQFNAGLQNNMNTTQAGLNQGWQQMVNQMGLQNAQNYLQSLMGMSTAGVGPNTVTQSPSFMQALGGIGGQVLGGWVGGR